MRSIFTLAFSGILCFCVISTFCSLSPPDINSSPSSSCMCAFAFGTIGAGTIGAGIVTGIGVFAAGIGTGIGIFVLGIGIGIGICTLFSFELLPLNL